MCRPAAGRLTLSAQAAAKQTATETSTRPAGAARAAHDGAAAVGEAAGDELRLIGRGRAGHSIGGPVNGVIAFSAIITQPLPHGAADTVSPASAARRAGSGTGDDDGSIKERSTDGECAVLRAVRAADQRHPGSVTCCPRGAWH
jgi:hypothetical protein